MLCYLRLSTLGRVSAISGALISPTLVPCTSNSSSFKYLTSYIAQIKMSLRDRMSTQNAVQLLSIGTTLGLVTASSTSGGKYNFPLMVSPVVPIYTVYNADYQLFGLISHETSSNVLLHQVSYPLVC